MTGNVYTSRPDTTSDLKFEATPESTSTGGKGHRGFAGGAATDLRFFAEALCRRLR